MVRRPRRMPDVSRATNVGEFVHIPYIPHVPQYRLTSGSGTPLGIFEADDERAAMVWARALAGTASAARYGRDRLSYTVQRWHDDHWTPMSAWVPRPRDTVIDSSDASGAGVSAVESPSHDV